MEENTCHFCSAKAQYTCPRCNVQYCSSKCYKSSWHLKCSETFYKEMVEEQLKGTKASEDSKKKMLDILQRVHNETSEGDEDDLLDSDDDDDLAERLKDIDLDNSNAVWEKLNEEEKEEFLQLLKSGKTDDLIPPWKAWWDSYSFVTDVKDEELKTTPSYMTICPPLIECSPLFQVTKNVPSSCIPFNILNVLTSYIWTARLFNGDHQESCVDATEAILTLSPSLSAASNYASADVAINTPKIEAQNHPWLNESEEFNSNVKKDLRTILQGPSSTYPTFYILSALSDLHSLLSTCKCALAPKKKRVERSGLFKPSVLNASQEITKKFAKIDLVKSCIKKIEFYFSYVKEYPYKICMEI